MTNQPKSTEASSEVPLYKIFSGTISLIFVIPMIVFFFYVAIYSGNNASYILLELVALVIGQMVCIAGFTKLFFEIVQNTEIVKKRCNASYESTLYNEKIITLSFLFVVSCLIITTIYLFVFYQAQTSVVLGLFVILYVVYSAANREAVLLFDDLANQVGNLDIKSDDDFDATRLVLLGYSNLAAFRDENVKSVFAYLFLAIVIIGAIAWDSSHNFIGRGVIMAISSGAASFHLVFSAFRYYDLVNFSKDVDTSDTMEFTLRMLGGVNTKQAKELAIYAERAINQLSLPLMANYYTFVSLVAIFTTLVVIVDFFVIK